MNRLSYQLITDKKVKRQIDILSLLSSTKAPVTIEELSDEIGASERTISADLKDLVSKLPPEVKLDIFPKVGAILNWKTSYLLSDFITELSGNNPIFEIVEQLFHGSEKSLEEYAEELFISDITLKRKLLILKKSLKQFKLGLRLNPVQITGNEINIRCFFFSYFRNVASDSFRLCFNNEYSFHYQVVNEIKTGLDSSFHSDFRRAMQWMLVLEERILAGNLVRLPHTLIKQQVRKRSYINFKKIFLEKIDQHLNISDIIEDEIIFAYIVRLDTIVYQQSDNEQLNWVHENEVPSTIMESFINSVLSQFDIEAKNNEDLFHKLSIFLSNLSLTGQLSSLFQKNSLELNHKVKQLHPFTHAKCVNIITSTGIDNELSIAYVSDVAVSLTLIISSHMYDRNLKEKNILFGLSGESTYLNYFIMLSNCFLPRNSNILFSYNEEITDYFLKKNKIDLWIHNYPIERKFDGIVSFQISAIPSIAEWTLLIKLIIDISPDELHQFFDSYSENIKL